MARKVAIVGCADTADLAPYDDETWEIWATGIGAEYDRRWDRWFQLHDLVEMTAPLGRVRPQDAKAHVDWLREQTKPIYMQRKFEAIPASVAYPRYEVMRHFRLNDGDPEFRYYTSTLAWMAALAIFEGDVTDLGCFGVEMAHETEYADQRPCMTFYLGWARGAGIQVHVPARSSLLRSKWLYGWEDYKKNEIVRHISRLSGRRDDAQARMRQAENEARELIGAIESARLIKEDRI